MNNAKRVRLLVFGLALVVGAAALAPAAGDDASTSCLSQPADSGDWLRVGVHHRTRYETLDRQFRVDGNGSDQAFVFRTGVVATATFGSTDFAAELLDSRQQLADDGTALDTGVVNTLELLQAYVEFPLLDVLHDGSQTRVRFGRFTMDVGSRRLVARNRFRNTPNHFTGVRAARTTDRGDRLQAFYVLPVTRLPSDPASLLDNDVQFDREDFHVQFWGVHSELPHLLPQVATELYLFGLREADSADLATRNRRLYTAGVRFFRRPQAGQFDFEWESVLQVGRSRASKASTDTTDLRHLAHLQHIAAGYTFDSPWSPRLLFQFDYASGDRNPNDAHNNRFDPLYGARRFEFGPTSLYGLFARSNLVSPGYRLILKPAQNVEVMFAHRFYWLASSRDEWTTTHLHDPTGRSGNYLGHQPELRIRWKVLPDNWLLEVGVAHLFAGEFVKKVPGIRARGDVTYAYWQTILTF